MIMGRICLVLLIYGATATVAWLCALNDLFDERRESRQAWDQVQELRASVAAGVPVRF
jgi:hypothetical protein